MELIQKIYKHYINKPVSSNPHTDLTTALLKAIKILVRIEAIKNSLNSIFRNKRNLNPSIPKFSLNDKITTNNQIITPKTIKT